VTRHRREAPNLISRSLAKASRARARSCASICGTNLQDDISWDYLSLRGRRHQLFLQRAGSGPRHATVAEIPEISRHCRRARKIWRNLGNDPARAILSSKFIEIFTSSPLVSRYIPRRMSRYPHRCFYRANFQILSSSVVYISLSFAWPTSFLSLLYSSTRPSCDGMQIEMEITTLLRIGDIRAQ